MKDERSGARHIKRILAMLLAIVIVGGMLPGVALADSTSTYVGFAAGGITSTGNGINNPSSVMALYVMDEDAYKAMVNANGTPSTDNAEVAYCFNSSKSWPKEYTTYDGKINPITYTTKLTNATNDEFNAKAANVASKNKISYAKQSFLSD